MCLKRDRQHQQKLNQDLNNKYKELKAIINY